MLDREEQTLRKPKRVLANGSRTARLIAQRPASVPRAKQSRQPPTTFCGTRLAGPNVPGRHFRDAKAKVLDARRDEYPLETPVGPLPIVLAYVYFGLASSATLLGSEQPDTMHYFMIGVGVVLSAAMLAMVNWDGTRELSPSSS